MKKKLFLISLMFFLASCTLAETPVGTSTGKTDSSAYPAPALAMNTPTSPYPVNEPTSESDNKPTRDVTQGQVFGKLEISGKPVNNFPLYLAKVVTDEKGNEIVVNFSRDLSILTHPESDGSFEFVNVPPGRYGFVVDRIKDSVLMTVPGTDLTMLVTVLAGQSQNLGNLQYEQMPTNNP